MIERTEYLNLWAKLAADKAMILMTGARQSGKTTLSNQIQKLFPNNVYFNWDIIANKKKLSRTLRFSRKSTALTPPPHWSSLTKSINTRTGKTI